MPGQTGWARIRRFALLGSESFDSYLHGIDGLSPQWNAQETDGSVLGAWNTAVALGRRLNLLTYGDYTAGAGWSNSGGQVALHTAGSVATFQQDGILAAGKTFQAKITISLTTAGSVTITDGGAAISGNGQATRTITSTGANFIITPTTDFDGSIDVAVTLVQQTNILASSRYPNPDILVDGDMEAATTAAWTANSGATLSKLTASPHSGTRYLRVQNTGGDTSSQARQDILTAGVRAVASGWYRTEAGGASQIFVGSTVSKGLAEALDWTFASFEATPNDAIFMIASNGANKYAEFDGWSVKPANPLNGDDTATTVGVATGIPAMPFARRFDGAAGYIALPSDYNSILDPATFSAFIFALPSWDANERDFFSHTIDADNYIRIGQSATAGTARWEIKSDGDLSSRTLVTGAPTSFSLFGISSSGGVMKAIYNGEQVGADITLVGTVIGNFATMIIGARNDTPTNALGGDAMQYDSANRELTPVEWLAINQRSGI